MGNKKLLKLKWVWFGRECNDTDELGIRMKQKTQQQKQEIEMKGKWKRGAYVHFIWNMKIEKKGNFYILAFNPQQI